MRVLDISKLNFKLVLIFGLVLLLIIGLAAKTVRTGAFYTFKSGGDQPNPVTCSSYNNNQSGCTESGCIWNSNCTTDCITGGIENPPTPMALAIGLFNTPCDDGDACTTDTGTVEDGDCAYDPISCDDGNACTMDSCDPAAGCVFSPVNCDDKDACTDDSCDPALGCTYTPVSCFDGDSCTTDTCDPITGCTYGSEICDDINACTTDGCDPATGCTYTPISCDDSNACTNDSCDPATGCVNALPTCDGTDQNTCESSGCTWASSCTQGYSALCGTTVTADITLNDSMLCSGYGLVAGADNITIDCNNFGITGSGSENGIAIPGRSGVTIKNCDIDGFKRGIMLRDSANNNIIQNNNLSNNSAGIELVFGTNYDNTLSNNIANSNTIGISLKSAENNIVTNNTANSNSNAGIRLAASSRGNTVSDNTANSNSGGTGHGIEVVGSSNNTVKDNTANLNENGGIFIADCDNNTVSNNHVNNNTNYGIYVTGVTSARLEDNELLNNGGDGIYSYGSVASVYNSNFEDNQNGYGIYDQAITSVSWFVNKDITCKNNDIKINGDFVVSNNAKITAENCVITVNGEEINLSSNRTGIITEDVSVGTGTSENYGSAQDKGYEFEFYSESGYTNPITITKYDELPSGVSGFTATALGTWVAFDATDPNPGDWVILKIYYTDAQVAAAGLDENTLRIQYCNNSTGTCVWETYDPPRGGVDTVDNYVWANTTHFSGFGIFGSVPTTPTPTQPSGGINSGAAALPPVGTITPWTTGSLDVAMAVRDKVKFALGQDIHFAELTTIGANFVTLKINSTPFLTRVYLGETKKIDLNADGTNDISATLNTIENKKAYLTFATLTGVQLGELPGETPPTEAPSTAGAVAPIEQIQQAPTEQIQQPIMNWIVIIAVAVIAGVAAYWFVFKKK